MSLDGFELLTEPLAAPWREAAAVLAVDAQNRVLLQMRDDIPTIRMPGLWTMFGGHVEPGEDARAAAAREFAEETGIDRPVGSFAPAYAVFNRSDDSLCLKVFRLKADFGARDVRVLEGAGFGFFTPRQLARLALIPYVRRVFVRHYGRDIFCDGNGEAVAYKSLD